MLRKSIDSESYFWLSLVLLVRNYFRQPPIWRKFLCSDRCSVTSIQTPKRRLILGRWGSGVASHGNYWRIAKCCTEILLGKDINFAGQAVASNVTEYAVQVRLYIRITSISELGVIREFRALTTRQTGSKSKWCKCFASVWIWNIYESAFGEIWSEILMNIDWGPTWWQFKLA